MTLEQYIIGLIVKNKVFSGGGIASKTYFLRLLHKTENQPDTDEFVGPFGTRQIALDKGLEYLASGRADTFNLGIANAFPHGIIPKVEDVFYYNGTVLSKKEVFEFIAPDMRDMLENMKQKQFVKLKINAICPLDPKQTVVYDDSSNQIYPPLTIYQRAINFAKNRKKLK